MKIGLFFQETTFITEFPGSNFLLPTFLTGSKWDFQVANLLLSNPVRSMFNSNYMVSQGIYSLKLMGITAKLVDFCFKVTAIMSNLMGVFKFKWKGIEL